VEVRLGTFPLDLYVTYASEDTMVNAGTGGEDVMNVVTQTTCCVIAPLPGEPRDPYLHRGMYRVILLPHGPEGMRYVEARPEAHIVSEEGLPRHAPPGGSMQSVIERLQMMPK